MPWQKITIIGVGQLGGSLGLAVKKQGLAEQVIGVVRREEYIPKCAGMRVVDQATLDLEPAVREADLVILCTHISSMRSLVERMLPFLKPGAIVTDVASVKHPVVRELEPLVSAAGAHFVGSHPMAGSERAGVEAAVANLFEKKECAITPTGGSSPEAVSKVENFWVSVGAFPFQLAPELHDKLAGRTSHLTHIVAAELVNYVLSGEHPQEMARLCGRGFFDTTTRIASGSPEMWCDIVFANKDNLLQTLSQFTRGLQRFEAELANGNLDAVRHFFVSAVERRRQWERQRRDGSA